MEEKKSPSDSVLFTPGKMGPLELRNRTIRAAAFEGMCPGGRPSAELIDYHRSLAKGGIGMTTVAYAAVTPGGRTFAHQMWMREEILPDLRRLSEAVHQGGAAVSIQLGDAGNMADRDVTGVRAQAPSRLFNLFGLALPRAMSEADIEELIGAFGRAVGLCREAGFDAVELQAGHGYLISQFLSPATNRRKDQWGGSLPNRARLLQRVIEAALEAGQGRLAVTVKANLQDGFEGGMGTPEAIEVARIIEEAGAHGLQLSGGFVSKCPMYIMRGEVPLKEMVATQKAMSRKLGLALFGRLVVKEYPFTEAYFLQEALAVRAAVKMPLILVGGMVSLEKMEQALDQGMDFVAMARALFIEPDFVDRLRRGERRRSPCEPCNRCMATMYYGPAECTERQRLLSNPDALE